jgi:beta-lactamase regulating signal transducer with metallopeptidase domain
MSALAELLLAHGPLLLGVTSALLALGTIAGALARAPIHQQRLAEATLLATLVWLALALAPLPRFAWSAPAATGILPADDARETIDSVATLVEANAILSSASDGPDTLAPPLPVEIERGEAPPPPARTEIPLAVPSLAALIVWSWLGVSAAALAYLVVGLLALGATLRRASTAPAWLRDLAVSLADSARVRAPHVRVSNAVERPFCVGVGRGIVVLPASLCDAAETDTLRHVLHHELAHLRQRDALGHLLFSLALPLFALHPLYWWLRHRAHFAAELVADDWAASRSSPGDYARQLVQLATRAGHARGRLLGALPILSNPSDFYRRMTMLLARNSRLSTRCSRRRRLVLGAIAGLVTLGAAAIFGVSDTRAQETKSATQDQAVIRELEKQRDQLLKEVERLHAMLDEQQKKLADRAGAQTLEERIDAILEERRVKQAEDQAKTLREAAVDEARRLLEKDTSAASDPNVAPPENQEDRLTRFLWKASKDEARKRQSKDSLHNLGNELAVQDAPNPDLPPETEQDRAKRLLFGRGSSDLPSPSPDTAANSYILDLTMRLIDLRSDIDTARVRVAHAETLAKQGGTGTEEQELAVIELKKAERKLSAVLRLIEVERTAAAVEIDRLQKQLDEARASGTSTADLEAHLKLLHLRLELLSQAI